MSDTPPLVRRFQRCRWGATRAAIDALACGGKVHLAVSELNNAKTSAQRLRDAYEGARAFTVRGKRRAIVVERVR